MKITIAGALGSGKSSVSQELCRKLGYEYISTGKLQRKIASKYNIDSLELNKLAEKDKTIDNKIDSMLIKLNNKDNDLIIDSRMAWHFVENTFKIYLQVQTDIGVKRIVSDKSRRNEPEYYDKKSATEKILARQASEKKRFRETYNVDCDNPDNYDLVIDTSFLSVEDTAELIIELSKKWEQNIGFKKFRSTYKPTL